MATINAVQITHFATSEAPIGKAPQASFPVSDFEALFQFHPGSFQNAVLKYLVSFLKYSEGPFSICVMIIREHETLLETTQLSEVPNQNPLFRNEVRIASFVQDFKRFEEPFLGSSEKSFHNSYIYKMSFEILQSTPSQNFFSRFSIQFHSEAFFRIYSIFQWLFNVSSMVMQW